MKFTRIAREAEEFDRVLRGGYSTAAYASEVRLTAALSAADVRPDPAFTVDLRASLLQAAREGAIAAGPAIHPSRRTKRRWTIVAPAAAVALATGGVAFAVTGLQTSNHATPIAAPATAAAVLSTAHIQLADISQQVRSGRTTAVSLTTLRTQALRLRDMLIATYGSGRDPQAIRELHSFALSAISQLAALHAQIPASLTPLYLSTLQTLVDIATSAESTCQACDLPPVQVPSSVAPYLHLTTIAQPGGAAHPTPPASTTPGRVLTPTTVTAVPKTRPSRPGFPTILPLPNPSTWLPTALPTLHF